MIEHSHVIHGRLEGCCCVAGVASQQVRPARAGGRGVAGWFFQETVSGEALDARERAVARLLSLEVQMQPFPS